MTHLVLGYPGLVATRFIELEARKGQQLVTIAPGIGSSDLPEGVRHLVADPSDIDFGLSGQEYRALLDEVSSVTLAETLSRSVKEVDESRLVRQCVEVLEFVRAGGAPEGVRFLSSLLIFGNSTGAVSEEDFEVGQRFESRDEEALAVGEKIIRRLVEECPTAILRVAPLVGDEERGVLFEHSALARLARQIGAASTELTYTYSDLPVWLETVGRAARALSLISPVSGGMTYHLVDEEPLTDRSLIAWLAERAHCTITEGPPTPALWSGWQRPVGAEQRVVRGWGLTFGRKNALSALSELLDRDPYSPLTSLLGPLEKNILPA